MSMATSTTDFGSKRDAHNAHQSAYLIEALLLLTILATAIAVFTSLFALAMRRGNESVELDRATHLATNVAERFVADPVGVLEEYEEDGYRITCDVIPERTDSGVFYRAAITVWTDANESLYTIETARYVSEVS